jgi:DMSO/TMAO reductase YedYZ molybdopterin-dependent catalytic subunit
MHTSFTTRRELLTSFSAGLAVLSMPSFVFPGQEAGEEHVPFEGVPRSGRRSLDWETLTEWLTPQDQVFDVQHYGSPAVNPESHELEITGLVERPIKLTLADIQRRPKDDQLMTLECSGNGSNPGFTGAVYNSRWTGTRLAPLLKECGIKPGALEVVFFGVDEQEETLRKGTPRELTVKVPFGRSMSVEHALRPDLLLAYERNGEPMEKRNGAPLRLIVPGWYGIANVKWLKRIEVRDRRYMGRFMGRDYVTVRGERQDGEVVFVESSVTRMNLKSVIARVTRKAAKDGKVPLKAYGAVWGDGTPIKAVEVKLDGGDWWPAKIDENAHQPEAQARDISQPEALARDTKYCWRFFSIDLGPVGHGKHTLVSRGIDETGRIQPAAADDEIALKKTYWEAYQQWPRTITLEG